MTSKFLLLCCLGTIAALVSSCAPFVPYQRRAPLTALPPDLAPSTTIDDEEQRRIKELREEAARNAGNNGFGANDPPFGPNGNANGLPGPGNGTPQGQKPVYRYALQIPGKEGFVFNPFTNNPVDVRGIPSGTLVRDPQDTNPDHKFRVP